jgi:hypothetical protein
MQIESQRKHNNLICHQQPIIKIYSFNANQFSNEIFPSNELENPDRIQTTLLNEKSHVISKMNQHQTKKKNVQSS